MRLKINHQIIYNYSAPVARSVQSLRLTPGSDERQRVVKWQLDLPGTATEFIDAFGNITQLLTVEGSHTEIRIGVDGIVDMAEEPIPNRREGGLSPLIFLRETALTAADPRLYAFSEKHQDQITSSPLAALQALTERIRSAVRYSSEATGVQTTAADVLSQGSGTFQDLSHLFIACCRILGIPARYISGYLYSGSAADPKLTLHAWAEAWVDQIGWLDFDISNAHPAKGNSLRLAIGRDDLDACPVRRVPSGGSVQTMAVQVQVMNAQQ